MEREKYIAKSKKVDKKYYLDREMIMRGLGIKKYIDLARRYGWSSTYIAKLGNEPLAEDKVKMIKMLEDAGLLKNGLLKDKPWEQRF